MKMSLFKDIVLGIDIGGTTCKCGVFTTDGTLVYKDEIPTRKDEGGSLILSDIKEHIPELVKAAGRSCDEIKGVGIGVPGAVREDGTVNKCVNLGWGVFNVAQTFKDMTGYEVKVGNDANMAALGEYWMGSAKAYSSVVLVTIGTGVGGGVIIDGKPLKTFMLKQTTNDDMKFFLDLKGQSMSDVTGGATDNITLENYSEKLGFETVIPAFIVSELKRAFQMGFLIFIPFLVIDLVVSSTLMAMGMMMLPPAMISLPFKIILFVLVDGWQLMVGTIVNSYNL